MDSIITKDMVSSHIDNHKPTEKEEAITIVVITTTIQIIRHLPNYPSLSLSINYCP